ncbi:4'-phosphopantetheinyl transferase [Nocardiopsis gilva YIM 90087]|uniref:4'-phosphopantetheinyl transferase n=1 Tax=Nocardiopsis gilva YIM 90087 TaxID=1235441 RepID=A0A223SB75_9ACTN|nr:4'-phosphopantetheinyl transferase superfamily protein [Nocardiopsis gilva]ASU85345.1 4'-phosphopantetheinyl transferase [Nocardiopsis gilva YIM 90087]
MIEQLLTPEVVGVEAFDDRADARLFPEEEALLARAVDKRRREFTTVRACARDALAELGFPPAPLLPGERGAPGWPQSAVGSMTHCAGYRAAAVARATDVETIGIDAEPHGALPDGVLETIALPEERVRLKNLAVGDPGVSWDRLLFSAKESVYKAWFPLTRMWLGFEEADIAIDPEQRTFTARLLVDGPVVDGRRLGGFEGRWIVGNGLVVTGIAVPKGNEQQG